MEVLSFPRGESNPVIYFTKHPQEIVSLSRSTFGGFIFAAQTSKTSLDKACEEFIGFAKEHQVPSITIRCMPDVYQPQESKLAHQTLSALGFSTRYTDITQYIPVNPTGLRLNTHRKRRLRSCESNGYQFKILTAESLPQAYPLFVESRNNKRYPITMSLEDFQTAFEQFPDRYLLCGVFNRTRMIAASVCINLHPQILYVFFIGDALAYRKQSPVTMLINGIYSFAKTQKFEIVDLGVSTDNGVLNEGLHDFKKSFGALDSKKLTYQLKL